MRTKYLPCETATSFNFTELIIKIKKEIREEYDQLAVVQKRDKYPQLTEDQLQTNKMPDDIFHEAMLSNLKKFTINEQVFSYKSFKNNLGGFRWYVVCPQCNELCLKLYLPNKYKDKEQRYLCKDCHGLKNSSSLLGATKKYRKVVRPLKRLEILKSALMKKGISSEKAKPLLEEYEKIERELNNSPEYRLWRFQLEHTSLITGNS
jgi:hypothetical protein